MDTQGASSQNERGCGRFSGNKLSEAHTAFLMQEKRFFFALIHPDAERMSGVIPTKKMEVPYVL
jgi:hypothetical protein